MPDIVKIEYVNESAFPVLERFCFETNGGKGTLKNGEYIYPLSEEQVQKILAYAQETDLAGKLRKGMGFLSRESYTLEFDDGTTIRSTNGGYETINLFRQMKNELGEPVNKAEVEKKLEELARRAAPHDRTKWNCGCGMTGLSGNFCSECGAARPPKISEVEPWDCKCGMNENTGKYCCNCGMPIDCGNRN